MKLKSLTRSQHIQLKTRSLHQIKLQKFGFCFDSKSKKWFAKFEYTYAYPAVLGSGTLTGEIKRRDSESELIHEVVSLLQRFDTKAYARYKELTDPEKVAAAELKRELEYDASMEALESMEAEESA